MSSSCVGHGFNQFTRLKLDPPKSNFSQSVAPPSPGFTHPDYHKLEENNTTRAAADTENKGSCDDDDGDGGGGGGDVEIQRNVDVGGWSFLQFLSNASENHKETGEKEEKVYVHPLVKRSASMLSEKSLEMCTESLGSESSDGGGISLISLETEICTAIDPPQLRPRESSVSRKTSGCVSFPPPLTSISSGSNGVQVRPRREGGRLVLEAVVTVTASHTYFHAERSEGRLRLCILKDFPPNYMDNEEDLEEEEEEEEAALDEEEEEVDEDDVEEEVKEGEDIEENNEKVRGEMGVKKMPRLSRCKEGGRVNDGLLNWDSFWFATSS